jgi:hypothetical protein
MDKPVLKQLDHVIARVGDAVALHRIFSETFGLPVAWDVKSYASFTSGGISLGNLMLEILTVGEKSSSSDKSPAYFCAFAFECDSLAQAVEEIRRRRLSCSAVVPYIESPSNDLPKTHLWSNAFLDGLIGSDFWTRYIIFSTRMPGYMFWANLLRGSKIEQSGMSRLFNGSLVFLVEYEYQNFTNMPRWSDFKSHDEKRAFEREALRAKRGGPLGLLRVQEITVAVKDYEKTNQNWARLLSPSQPVAAGLWEIANGPAVRLLPSDRDAIQSLVLKVSDPERAKTFLRERGMLDSTSDEQIRIDPGKIYGLEIRLV